MGKMPRNKICGDDLATPTAISRKIDKIVENLNAFSKDLKIVKQNVAEVSELKKEVQKLNDTICNQNKVIVDLISELKVIVKSNLNPGSNSSKYAGQFPIRSEAELVDLEAEICEETRDAMISSVKKIIDYGGIKKNIKHIFDLNLLMQFNVDGRQNMKKLVNYPNILNVIYSSISEQNYNKRLFLDDLRKAIRLKCRTC